MDLHPWRGEALRLFGICLLVPILQYFTGSWWETFTFVLTVYIGLLWRKIYLIHAWLKNGMPDDNAPHFQGVMGHFVTLIYRYKKSIEASNQEQIALTEQFNETISAIPSATVILNQNDEIDWANYAALSLLGISGQRDIGIKIDNLIRQTNFVKHLHQDNGDHFEIQSPVSANLTLAVQIVKYAQRRRLLLAHNISSHIEVQRSRKTFIANASHELRTPLTVVAGYLEFVQSDPALPDGLRYPVEKAIEQSNQMEILINDLLVLSKLEDKELSREHLSTIQLKKHLEGVLQTLEASGKTADHKLRLRIEKDVDIEIEVNEKELNSVCYNFINNAIKYSEPKSKITIKLERASDAHVRFSVIDQGIGIAPEHIMHLTERFYRVDSGRSKRVGGTGLGLSIVKHILERHHGRLEIHSTLGEGSTFSAVLPIHPLGEVS